MNASTGAFVQAMGFGGTGGLDDDLASLCYDPVTQDIFPDRLFQWQYNVHGYPNIK